VSRRLPDRLQDVTPPDAAAARARARAVVLAAHAEHAGSRAPRAARGARRALAPVAATLVLALGAGALAATPPGDSVRGWVRDLVAGSTTPPRPAPSLDRLPAPGRLLVTGPGGAWIVAADGSRRRLGPYTQATWSPHGLFVGAVRGRQLVAVDPGGVVRWTLAAPLRVRDPRWAPSGFRVAYRAGASLRVVAGDGSGDRLIARHVAPVAPAWRPAGARNELTYVDGAGALVCVDVDTGRRLSRTRPVGLGGRPRTLEWSASGRRLLVMGPGAAQTLTPAGAVAGRSRAPAGATLIAAALAPDARRVALVSAARSGHRTVLIVTPDTGSRTLFATGGGGVDSVAWSPDGRILLVPWAGTDQWLFLGTGGGTRTTAVAHVAVQFDIASDHPRGAPTIDGWCCR
jgi:hypothetical protein